LASKACLRRWRSTALSSIFFEWNERPKSIRNSLLSFKIMLLVVRSLWIMSWLWMIVMACPICLQISLWFSVSKWVESFLPSMYCISILDSLFSNTFGTFVIFESLLRIFASAFVLRLISLVSSSGCL